MLILIVKKGKTTMDIRRIYSHINEPLPHNAKGLLFVVVAYGLPGGLVSVIDNFLLFMAVFVGWASLCYTILGIYRERKSRK